MGGRMSGQQLEKLLYEHGRQGWQLKSVTAVEIRDASESEGSTACVTFERPPMS